MTEGHVEATEGSRGPRRWRYLIDIVVLLAVTLLLDAALGAFVQVPIDLEKGFVLDAIIKVLLVGVGCGLVLLRGERLADIGLKRPKSWTRTLIIGVHRHTRHFDGTAGSSVGAKSLGRDYRTRAFRRESFCFVLFSRPADVKQEILPAQGCALKTSRHDCLRHGCCFRGAPGGRALPITESSALQQARIEPILDRLANFDSFEIWMPGI